MGPLSSNLGRILIAFAADIGRNGRLWTRNSPCMLWYGIELFCLIFKGFNRLGRSPQFFSGQNRFRQTEDVWGGVFISQTTSFPYFLSMRLLNMMHHFWGISLGEVLAEYLTKCHAETMRNRDLWGFNLRFSAQNLPELNPRVSLAMALIINKFNGLCHA